MLPADPASRAGSTPEASGDSSSGTFGEDMKPSLLLIAFLFICSQCFAERIPSSYAGVWVLTSYVKDSQTKPPAIKHYLILTTEGEMTRVKGLYSAAS